MHLTLFIVAVSRESQRLIFKHQESVVGIKNLYELGFAYNSALLVLQDAIFSWNIGFLRGCRTFHRGEGDNDHT